MSPAERNGQTTHGPNIPYARFGGRHSPERAPGTDTQQANANQRPFSERSPYVSNSHPNWNQVTAEFFNHPGSPETQAESGRHRVTSPEELMRAGIDAANAAARVRDKVKLKETLHQQQTEDDSLLVQMALIAAHFARLGVGFREIDALVKGLAHNHHHIGPFLAAFSDADTIAIAVSRLPWDQATQSNY